MIQLPITKNGNSDFDVSLEGETFTLQFRFNGRNNRIYMNILQDDVPLKMGIRLIEGSLPGDYIPIERAPGGIFVVAQIRDTDEIATLGNFGVNKEYTLLYISEDEVT